MFRELPSNTIAADVVFLPMGLFPRRILQRELDFLRPGVVDPLQEKDILKRLNGRERQAISTEWEIAIAAAFARIAKVKYEAPIGGKRPDLLVSPGENAREFVAEIVAISDEDLDRKNPASYFFEEFRRFTAKHGLVNGGFDIRIGDRTTGKWPDKVNTLLLPPKKEISSFIRRELTKFVRSIMAEPTARHTYQRVDREIDLRINYDPARLDGSTGGYSCYSSAYSLTRNPLFAALNSKASKLRQSGYTGPKGIIVVDGGAFVLRANQGGSTWSCSQIVERFLRGHNYIDFVTVTYHEHGSFIFGDRRQRFKHTIFWQRPFDQAKIDRLYPLLNETFKSLPTPIDSPHNAVATVRSRRSIDRGRDLGWYTWTPNHRLAYSVRTLLPLIGGFMSHLELKQLLNDHTPFRNPLFDFFFRAFQDGRKIIDVHIERRCDHDDDAIVFDLDPTLEREQKSHADEATCEIPADILIRYFVQLATEVIRPKQERFSIGVLPIEIQQRVREFLRAGRLPVAASIRRNGIIRLCFGEPDPAVSAFR